MTEYERSFETTIEVVDCNIGSFVFNDSSPFLSLRQHCYNKEGKKWWSWCIIINLIERDNTMKCLECDRAIFKYRTGLVAGCIIYINVEFQCSQIGEQRNENFTKNRYSSCGNKLPSSTEKVLYPRVTTPGLTTPNHIWLGGLSQSTTFVNHN